MNYYVYSANQWMFPDGYNSEKTEKVIASDAARNSYACTQVLLTDVPGGALKWDFDLPDALSEPMINKMLPVFVEKNTGRNGFLVKDGEDASDYVTRKAPFYVYDAIVPIENGELCIEKSGENVGLYIKWKIGENFVPGEYSGKLNFYIGNDEVHIPVRINVFPAVVPSKNSLLITNWYSPDDICLYHKVEEYSEEYWEILKKYAFWMRYVHQTHFYVHLNRLKSTKDENGNYHFDFTNVKRLINMFLDMGFQYIEGGDVAGRKLWEENEFFAVINGEKVRATSEEGYHYLHDLLTAWNEFLTENNWKSILLQHVGDEPHKGCKEEYCILSGIVRKFMPGVRIIEAVETSDLSGAVDVIVPKNVTYCAERESFEKLRSLGDELWYYTCCLPGGKWLNRLQDGALIRTRYIHWGNMLYNMAGYLHWGFNFYSCLGDPFKGTDGRVGSLILPHGDTHIVYPYGQNVCSSARLEAMRFGVEDYELLLSLKEKKREYADEILHKCITSFTEYTEDIKEFNSAYRELLKAPS